MLPGSRILLRPWCESDLPFFGELRNDLETQLALLAQPRPNPPSRVRQWLDDRSTTAEGIFFVIASRDDDRPLGFVELRGMQVTHARAELGICLSPAARGQGFAAEALQLVESYARRVLMLRKIVLYVVAGNVAACHLYEAAGYVAVGIHREHYCVANEWLDAFAMEKLLAAPESLPSRRD